MNTELYNDNRQNAIDNLIAEMDSANLDQIYGVTRFDNALVEYEIKIKWTI